MGAMGSIGASVIFVGLIVLFKKQGRLTYTLPWIVVAVLVFCVGMGRLVQLNFNESIHGYGPLADALYSSAPLLAMVILAGGFAYYLISQARHD